MAVSIRTDPETGTAIAECSGVLGRAEAKEGAVALWANPGWTGKGVVWDFRDASFDLSSTEIRDLAGFVLGNQPTPPAKVAFVVPRSVDFGLARIFEAYREDPRTEFRVFREFDEALHWAGVPPGA